MSNLQLPCSLMPGTLLSTSGTNPLLSQSNLSLYRILGTVFLVLTIVFAVVSVILFFKLRIPQVYGCLTGRIRKRSIQEMQERNAQTGTLRDDHYNRLSSEELYRTRSGSIPTVMGPDEVQSHSGETGSGRRRRRTEKQGRQTQSVPVLSAPSQSGDGSVQTIPLNTADGHTVLMTPQMQQSMCQVQNTQQPPARRFIIVKEVMEIHTEETIYQD